MKKLGEIKLRQPIGNQVATKPTSERAELLRFFVEKTKYKPARLGMMLAHLSLKDLYYMKSVFEDKERDGKNAVAWLLWSVKVDKSTPQNKSGVQ